MWDRGWWTIFRWRGAPVRLHWSLAIPWLFFSRFQFVPAIWLGMLLIVLVHELGHAFLVRRYRFEVTSIDLTGLNGECQWTGDPSAWQVSVVAWGGVLAEALLLPLGLLLAPKIEQPFLRDLLLTFGWTNLWMIGFNLIPIPPLDGSRAWRLFPMWWESRRELRDYLKQRAARQRRTRAANDTGKLLRKVEQHDQVLPSQLDLPDEVAEQLERAMKRAKDEHNEKK